MNNSCTRETSGFANDDSVPSYGNISDYVFQYATLAPDREAMVCGDVRLTYEQFGQQVQSLARALFAAGVRKGDRVATLCTPHPDFFVAFLASAAIGAIWVGLNPRYRTAELCYVVSDAEPSILLTRVNIDDRCYVDEIKAMSVAAPSMARVVVLGADNVEDGWESLGEFCSAGDRPDIADSYSQREISGGRDPLMIVYTSGSTGKPKGALLHHEGVVEMSRIQNQVWPVSRLSMLNYFPVNHVGCVVDVSCPVLVVGGRVVFMEQFDPENALTLIERERVTCWASVPSTFEMQLALPNFDCFDLSSVELIIWEGAAMAESTIEKLGNICPRMATNYGMTETTSAITLVEPTSSLDILAHTVGLPAPGVEIRLVAPDGECVQQGQEGEVQVRSPFNMLSYWRRPTETAETLLDGGWLCTGDTAVQRPDGRYRIVGRLKEMFKSGGYNVYPREIEQILETYPGVVMAAVVGVQDRIWQEVGVAFVEGSEHLNEQELLAYCRANLANYKVPKRIVISKHLPLLPIGKIDKVTLRRQVDSDVKSG